MYYDNDQIKVIGEFLDKPWTQKLLTVGSGLGIAEAIKEYMLADYSNREEKKDKLIKLIWRNDTKYITEVFSGKEFGALKLLLGEAYAQTFKDIWDRSVNCTYTSGYTRRSYRTKISTSLYLNKNLEKLKQYVYLAATRFSVKDYLANNKTGYQEFTVIADIIAVEIDNGNRQVLDSIHDIIYNDNNTAIVTREIIQGLLMSKSSKAHEMVGELLLAARLQEGLRQTIVESMDECCRESFLYLLRLILDNNLSRFSSIVRAFGTWTGLGLDVERPKVIVKCLEAAYACLTDSQYLQQCLNSDDNLLIYIGIWAVAFDEVEEIDSVLLGLLEAKEPYKRKTALMFLYETQFTVFRHSIACRALEDEDIEVVALAVKNLFSGINLYSIRYSEGDLIEDFRIDENCYGEKLYNRLHKILERWPKKEITFDELVFPWVNMTLSAAEIVDHMLLAMLENNDNSIIEDMIEIKDKMSVDTRQVFVEHFLEKPTTEKQRKAVLEMCGDRGSSVREAAFRIINKMKIKPEEYIVVENFLQYKSGDLRKNSIKLLLMQDSAAVLETVKRLVESGNANKRLAAMDITGTLASDKRFVEIAEASKAIVASLGDMSQKESILTSGIFERKEEIKTISNGLGLFDTSTVSVIPLSTSNSFDIKSVFSLSEGDIKNILQGLSDLIHQHREFEYESEGWDGAKTKVVLGAESYLHPFSRGENKLSNYPLASEIGELVVQKGITTAQLIQLHYCMKMVGNAKYRKYEAWFEKFLENSLGMDKYKGLDSFMENIPYSRLITSYVELLVNDCPTSENFEVANDVSRYLFTRLSKEEHLIGCEKREGYYYSNNENLVVDTHEFNYWLRMMKISASDDDHFRKYFNLAFHYYSACDFRDHATLSIEDFGRALDLDIINKNEVYRELVTRPLAGDNISNCTYTRYRNNEVEKYKQLMEISDQVVETVTEIEAGRGELDTEVTKLAARIGKCKGAKLFVAIILNSEKDTYIRGYNFVNGDCTKKQMLSHLLKCCYPYENENVESLRLAIGSRKITPKQLVEAAMYAPQWLDIVSEYLGYDGLRSACWYFHAHVNDMFSEEKAAIVARYSPISAQDFRDGAFDGQWFMDAYNTIGEKHFKLVYDSAKYIAGGGLHKRSQLFADAVLGKLKLDEVKERVMDKRNKDYMLCYGLVPIKDKRDVLERYEYIHQFIKESKQFGAQRQASEGRSAAIALLNLARSAGYSDINRLSWNMETAKLDSIREYLVPKAIDELEVWISIDENGKSEIKCSKKGNELRDIPAKYKKYEYIQQLRAVKKSLNDQHARARGSFEEMMVKGEAFEAQELQTLCGNPVLAPIIKKLVYVCESDNDYVNEIKSFGDKIHGFLEGNSLVDYDGTKSQLQPMTRLIIAHPVHLYEAKAWTGYQRNLFERQLVQPFKQVFRELYLPNADELSEGTHSRRYAGHQVQPKKTLALLKTRGWLASHEEGLQKVFYQENIVATIYAMADWFSPSEIEAPTLEIVRFEDRKSFKPVMLKDIPKLIFSEVMRDVDLVVSVAHVGGVDPEASISTIEIRAIIVEELLRLLKLDNVVVKGTHAHIAGVHGNYTVHLGSGVVHKMGTGAINILPVHSSHRGRIFLPFVDDDPRSAEIMSKIILLAEDKKLKDPTILTQITQL